MNNILTKAVRQYQHNDGSGFVMAYDKSETEAVVNKQQNRIEELEAALSSLITSTKLARIGNTMQYEVEEAECILKNKPPTVLVIGNDTRITDRIKNILSDSYHLETTLFRRPYVDVPPKIKEHGWYRQFEKVGKNKNFKGGKK